MLYRALIKTHHMTSRKKITAILKAAKKYNCAVYLKTGAHPPGVMIGECDAEQGEQDLKEWVGSVKVGDFLASDIMGHFIILRDRGIRPKIIQEKSLRLPFHPLT